MTRPSDLTDDDFRAIRRQLLEEMCVLDGAAWQEAEDLRDECDRAMRLNELAARVRVARAVDVGRVRRADLPKTPECWMCGARGNGQRADRPGRSRCVDRDGCDARCAKALSLARLGRLPLGR